MPNWRAMLAIGLEAMDEAATIVEIDGRIGTGRPLASPEWIADAEHAINRKLGPAKRGPKPGRRRDEPN